MKELIRFLLVGFVLGWTSNILARSQGRKGGCLPVVFYGMAGALAGGYLLNLLADSPVLSVVAAALGAITVLRLRHAVRNA